MKKEIKKSSYVTSIERLGIGLSILERGFRQGHMSEEEFKDTKKVMERSKKRIKNNYKKDPEYLN